MQYAFVWKDGAYTILPCPPPVSRCSASSISDNGTIVGGGTDPNSGDFLALWIGGEFYELNTLIDPNDPLRTQVRLGDGFINASGQIVTDGVYTSGPYYGRFEVFVLSPED